MICVLFILDGVQHDNCTIYTKVKGEIFNILLNKLVL